MKPTRILNLWAAVGGLVVALSTLNALGVELPPTITTQPTSQTAAAGAQVTFSVTATPVPPTTTYQWRFNSANLINGGNISGVTSTTLSLADVSAADAGTYTVVVTDHAGSVISAPAVLTVATFIVRSLNDSGSDSLREAISLSQSGDTITFDPSLNGTIALITGELLISHDLTITNPGPSALAVSGSSLSRVFNINAGATVSISGLSLTQGKVTGASSGPQSYPTPGLGGVILNNGTLALNGCTISGGSANGGDGNSFYDGADGQGGGIANNGTLALTGCTLSGNSATGGNGHTAGTGAGGGIANLSPGTLALTNCTLSGNQAFGGVKSLYSVPTPPVNGGDADGGAIYSSGTDLILVNCTLSGNGAGGGSGGTRGGDAYGGGVNHSSGTVGMKNTIVSGNTAIGGSAGTFGSNGTASGPDVYGTVTSLGFNLIGDSSGGSVWGSSDLKGSSASPLDPLLGPLQNNGGPTPTMALLPGSAAIDNGGPGGPATDQRGTGFSRPVANSAYSNLTGGDRSDIGAYEASGGLTAPLVVSHTADDNLPGSLRRTIASAPSGVTITFAAALGGSPIPLASGELVVDRDLTITGPGANVLTVSGSGLSRVFNISAGATVSISGLSLTQGKVTGASSGPQSYPTPGLGGVILNNGTLALNGCTISGGSANGGDGNSFYDGADGQGGGIANNGTLALTGCTLSGSSATGGNGYNGGTGAGGGIANLSPGTLALTNCTLSDNNAFGGIKSLFASPTPPVRGGEADGGAIYSSGTDLILVNCTLSGNGAAGGGGGSSGGDAHGGGINGFSGTTVTIINTIVSDNAATGGTTPYGGSGTASGPDVYGTVTSLGHNLIGDPSGGTRWSGNDLTGANATPLNLGPLLADNGGPTPTMALLPGSAAINAGDDAVLSAPYNLTTDQRGQPRKFGASVDIGAFELQASPAPSISVQPAGQSVECGAGATFSVTATGGAGPLTYQWKRGSTPVGTGSTLSVTPASSANAGTYTVVVSDGTTSVTSAQAVLTVTDTTPPVITLLGSPVVTNECHTAYTDAGATAFDACDGNLTAQIVTVNPVGASTPPGSYTVTYNVQDSSGHGAAQVTRTVVIVDTTPPVITLNGANPMTNECHTAFVDPGAAATDACDGTVGVTTNSQVNPNATGTYTICYVATDSHGNSATNCRTVVIVDTTPPVVTLNGASTMTIPLGVSFTDPGAVAQDLCAGGLPVTTSGSVNVNAAGTYPLAYTATDPSGNTASATRTVTVAAPPGIPLSTTTPYTQSFDSLSTSATAPLPPGFKVDKQSSVLRTPGTFASAGSATERVGGASMSGISSPGIYNFGSGTATSGGSDRAVGFLAGGTGLTALFSGNLYAQFANTTGGALSGLQVSYGIEKYRNGNNSAGFRVQLSYSPDGATWTSAGSNFLTSFGADANTSGYNPAPAQPVSGVNHLLPVNIPNGANLYLAWNYSVSSGTSVSSAPALAVDDVSVLGIVPLSVTCPSNITVAATSASGATVFFNNSASGGCPPVTVTSYPASGSTFPIGPTTVFSLASDACSSSNLCSFQVTVTTTPIVLNCSSNLTVPATSSAGATVFFSSTATGGCSPPTVTCTPSSGSTFPIGTTTVMAVANDTCGGSTNCSFTVTVTPLPLAISCPSNITATATGPAGATVFYTVTASGGCLPPPLLTVNPLSGSTFPIGTTTVTAWADGGCTNQIETCSFTVTVIAPPINIACPSNIVTTATGPTGASVSYSVTASGGCSPPPFVAANPPSGSNFPLGANIVNVTATDACGTSNTCSFTVTVNPLPQPQAPEYFFAQPVLPEPGSMDLSLRKTFATFTANGYSIIIRNLRHRSFSQSYPLPPLGASQTEVFSSVVDFEFSPDGTNYFPTSGTANVTVKVTHSQDVGGTMFFDTEMLQLDLPVVTVIGPLRLRESPTLHSTGQTTVRPVAGGYMISSFFDIFTELSTDGGANWIPAQGAGYVEMRPDLNGFAPVAAPEALWPPPNGGYASGQPWFAAYAQGVVIKGVSHWLFDGAFPLVPSGIGGYDYVDSYMDLQFSTDGGQTFLAVRVPAPAVVLTLASRGSIADTIYDTGILDLNLSLGNGVMVRISPTEPSNGEVEIKAQADGTYQVSSFFDIFTEVSLDGGATWAPTTNGPGRLQLVPIAPEVAKPTLNLPPLDGQYDGSSAQWFALYANGIIITNAVLDRFTQAQPPPPPGGTNTESFGAQVSGLISIDGGASFQPFAAPASASAQLNSRSDLDTGSTRFFDAEMLSLNLSGGSLPGGVMVRESPSKASLGRTSVRSAGTGYQISSFFDIFTEVSLDNGQTWSPSVTTPGTLALGTNQPGPALSITCPSNITVTATGPAGAQVFYTVTSSGGSCPPVNVVANPPSGSTFPVGTTTVHATASDPCGDSATCSFTVTVSPPPGPQAPEYFFAQMLLPPVGSVYISPGQSFASFAQGIVIRDVRHRFFTQHYPLPALGTSQTETYSEEMDFNLSTDNGATFQPASGTANVTVQVTHTQDVGGTMFFDTEMTQLDLSSSGLRLRESPTLHSTGQTTVRPVAGGYMISSFFDVFTEVSLDGGNTWQPAQQSGHVEMHPDPKQVTPVAEPTALLPPPNGAYVTPQQWFALYAQGIVINGAMSLRLFTGALPPPAPGVTNTHNFNLQVDLQVSTDGGNTYQSMRVAAPAQMTVASHSSSTDTIYDTELTSLNLSLPNGVMIRESPTEPSRGQVEMDAQSDGTFRVTSFFDVFTELSLDGGASWSPATNGPARLQLVPIAPEVAKPTSNLPPLDGQYSGPAQWFALYANGIIITNAVLDRFLQTQPPPAPGSSQTESFGAQVSGLISMNGGASFQPFAAPASASAQLNSRSDLDTGSTRFFDTEMLSLNLSGGSLPGGIMVRESPSKASLGRTSVRSAGTGYQISSFFDIFTEVSLDNGQTWSPSVTPPGTLALGTNQPVVAVTITCPSSITILATGPGGFSKSANSSPSLQSSTVAGPGGAVVFFTVTAGGGCTPPTVVANPPSGTMFPIGTTTVTATASDTCGNTDSCTFLVTVERPALTITLAPPPGTSATIKWDNPNYRLQGAAVLSESPGWKDLPGTSPYVFDVTSFPYHYFHLVYP